VRQTQVSGNSLKFILLFGFRRCYDE
jgi:hypothetical protein